MILFINKYVKISSERFIVCFGKWQIYNCRKVRFDPYTGIVRLFLVDLSETHSDLTTLEVFLQRKMNCALSS